MASKRKSNSSEIPVDEPKRRHGDTSTDGNNWNAQCTCTCTCGGSSNYRRLEFMIEVVGRNCQRLESMIEKVKKEFTVTYQPPRLTSNECGGISECFELRFTNKLQKVYYTQTKILAEGGEPVQIDLFDIGSQCEVRDGPMSCMKVKICVVDGEIGSDIIKRDGKKELLKGDTTLTLQHGHGVLPKIEFTDNSRWVRTGTFKLAAKSKSNDPNIREAVSEPFTVKEKRGKAYEKHDQPSLTDNIWRLRNIAKGGKIHTLLSKSPANIETVKDLMRLHTTDPSLLKQTLGKISSNKLEEIIEHAKACAIDGNENYIYVTHGCSLVLNSIYEVVRVSFDGQYYVPSELNHYRKEWLEFVKQQAYQNEKDFILVTRDDLLALANTQVGQFSAPQQGQPYSCGPSTLENSGSEIPIPIYCDLQQFDFSSAQQGQASTSKSLVGVALQNGHVGADQTLLRSSGEGFISQIQMVNCLSPTSSWGLENPFGFPSGYGAELSDHSCLPYSAAMVISGRGNGKTVWNKIRNALKVIIPFVAKRKAKLSIPSN